MVEYKSKDIKKKTDALYTIEAQVFNILNSIAFHAYSKFKQNEQ